MTQYIVRLAVADDRPEVLRLQEQFIAELADLLASRTEATSTASSS